jgi:hypothetical protein
MLWRLTNFCYTLSYKTKYYEVSFLRTSVRVLSYLTMLMFAFHTHVEEVFAQDLKYKSNQGKKPIKDTSTKKEKIDKKSAEYIVANDITSFESLSETENIDTVTLPQNGVIHVAPSLSTWDPFVSGSSLEESIDGNGSLRMVMGSPAPANTIHAFKAHVTWSATENSMATFKAYTVVFDIKSLDQFNGAPLTKGDSNSSLQIKSSNASNNALKNMFIWTGDNVFGANKDKWFVANDGYWFNTELPNTEALRVRNTVDMSGRNTIEYLRASDNTVLLVQEFNYGTAPEVDKIQLYLSNTEFFSSAVEAQIPGFVMDNFAITISK